MDYLQKKEKKRNCVQMKIRILMKVKSAKQDFKIQNFLSKSDINQNEQFFANKWIL